MYMLKNKFLLAFFALVFSTALKAQTITIDDARLALPAGQTYGSGSVVAVPVTLSSGCFAQNNVFTWKLYNGAAATGDSGKITAFYITYMNVTLPIGLASGSNYKVEVKASTVGSVSAMSAPFTVTNVASAVVARAVPAFSDLILKDEYYYGICDGNPLNGYALNDSSTVGGTDSLELVDNYRIGNPITKFPRVNGKFNLVFNPVTAFGKTRDAYYTAFVKTISPANIVSTKAYHIVNSSWDLKTYVEARSTTYSCAGDTISLGFVDDRGQLPHIQQNFPGAIINIDWKDGSSANYTQCQILAANSKILHKYQRGSCDIPNSSTGYKILSTVTNPFNVFNGPGLTGTCAAGKEDPAIVSIFSKPTAIFKTDTVVCANDTIHFQNLSNPGQGVANQSGLPTCAQLANYTWIIDSNFAAPLYQTQNGKVETRKDTAYSFNSNQPGYHYVSLYINNNYGFQAPCPSHDTIKRFCVDTAKVRPDFKLDSAGSGVLKDSIVGCAPVFCIKNITKRTFCVDTTQFNYYWRVLDATSPGPNYLEVPQNVNYSFTSGNKRSKSPCISINKTGKYFIELMASASCDLDSTTRMLKYVEANGDAGVNFPTGSDTLKNCGYTTNTSTLTIDYNPSAYNIVNPINDSVGVADSVHYTYQASTAGALSFGWAVTKNGNPAVYGTDYTFANTILDSALQYPKITFKKPGLFKVRVTFSNNCQPKTAIQYVAFSEPLQVSSGLASNVTDSICHTTNTFNITGASASTTVTNSPVGQIYWTTSGDGTFNPQSGSPTTPNIFSPVYTPGPGDLSNSCNLGATIILTISALPVQPSNCAVMSGIRKLFIRPCVIVADTAFNSCSGTSVNYAITKAGLVGSTFTWTSTVTDGTVNGNTSNASGSIKINDVLTAIGGDGVVRYTLTPQKDGCVGNSFIVRDTVRRIPSTPVITLIHPNNALHSMCSADTDTLQVTSVVPTDLFSWTSHTSQNVATGYSSGVNQTGFISDILYNQSQPSVNDTVTYVVKSISKYGCKGMADSNYVVVTPGPNVAIIYGSNPRYTCNKSCDTIRHSKPGVVGSGTFSIVSSAPNTPTFTDLNDSVTVVCDMVAGGDYVYRWTIAPALAGGCSSTSADVNVQIFDTLPTPFAGLDTSVCDVTGTVQRTANFKGTLTRPRLPYEFVKWNGTGLLSLNYTFNYTNAAVYPIELRVTNQGVCPDKVDTVLLRAYSKPSGGSLSFSPIQSSYCQGSTVTIKVNYDKTKGYVGSWQTHNTPFTGYTITPATSDSLIYTLFKQTDFSAYIYSKGWNFGCKDSAQTSGIGFFVDSPSVAGVVHATDTIVCTPGSIVYLSLTGSRGTSNPRWIVSTNSQSGPYSNAGVGAFFPVTISQTSWFRAIVQNGNCNPDTSAPIRIFLPTGADVAKTGNDTAVCQAQTFLLQGNTPVVGNGYWEAIVYGAPAPVPGAYTFDLSNNYQTTTNPVIANISAPGTYKFVWKVKNLNCDATSDTITIKNTAPIIGNTINTTADTVCSGTKVTVTGNAVSVTASAFVNSWEYSYNSGTSWNLGSTAANIYTFTTSTDVWVRRTVKADSCYDYSDTIKFIVQPKIANNTITPASNATCINTPVPNFTGSLPTGGSGTYNYVWNYGNSTDTSNHIWTNPGVSTQNYNPGFNLTDTLHFRRIVTSGKCSDTSAIATVVVYPDAKASFTAIKTVYCANQALLIDVPNPPALNTTFNWYADTVGGPRFTVGTGAGFPGYTITKSLDSVKITLIAASTFGCKSDSVSKWFYTSATPFAAFTVSVDSGCANNTGLNTTSFSFTNTTPNANSSSFSYIFNYGNGISTSSLNPNPMDYAPSTTGLDTTYNVVMTVTSQTCGSSQANHLIKIRTRPHVSFGLSPTYQCSGGPVAFTNQTIGSPNLTWNWKFGDGTGTSNLPNPTYIYNVATLTTFNPVLIASNECASDSATNSAVIAANTVTLNISVKGTDKYKCLPDTVTFYTNSIGGTSYFWDFGDGNLSVPSANGKDSIKHVYTKSGKFIVTLTGSTTCGSVVKTDSVFAYGTPIVAYSIAPNTTVCKGDTIKFTNLTDTATNYVWDFGNGTGGGVNPTRTYSFSGTYPVKLTATRFHNLPLGGVLGCTDVSSIQTITIRDTMPASFTITPLGASCLPFDVQFSNTTNITTLPISTINWTFGEPVAQSGNPVIHKYNQLGQYNVNLTIVNAGNCTYIDSQKVTVAGPIGTWTHDTGYICGNTPVNFQINASSTDSCTINYGDATPVVTVPFSTFPNPFTHVYTSGGNYTPTVTLKSVNGCSYFIGAIGTIKVDYVKAGYTINTPIQNCGNTVQGFTNKTTMDQSPALAAYVWNINGVTYNVPNPTVTFNTTGVYNVKMQVTSLSGCFDSVTTAPLYVKVNNIPSNLSITRQDTACVGQTINYTAGLSPSEDPITNYNWGFGNNTTGSGVSSQTIYNTTGVYFDTLTVVTSNGCTNTKLSNPLVINGSPIVSINPSIDTTICSGASINLSAFSSGATPIATYSWYPPIGLSATTGANVVATPTNLTKYIVTGTSAKGCADTASISIDVVQPYTVSVISSNTPHDSICIGEKIILYASGASSYLWSPAAGLDTIRGSKVVASPTATTVYTVIGTNAANCFTPSASISVGVGDTTRISLGLDTVYLQGGTTLPLTPSVVNGPIATWAWTPATNLSCSDCGNPIATVKDNVCYNVEATSIYGCKAQDNICIIAFCEASQVFIPNGFTPDGDGVNDYLWIKARGIKSVKSFRIFNRWGQVVFERANFTPVDYDKINAWDGRIKGVIAPTEVYIYTCEVVCENGTKFTYTGNVAVIK